MGVAKLEFSTGWPVAPVRRRSSTRAALAERESALVRAPLFASLPKRHLRAIAKVTSAWTYPKGSGIVEEGKRGTSFFVILEGRARVVKRGRTIGRLNPGEFFGEVSVLDPGPRTASVISDADVKCLELSGQDLLDLLAKESRMAEALLRVMARRLRENERQLVD
jgi:CRP/FNR family transcriptional regulator, cyclic AMP receptor protein